MSLTEILDRVPLFSGLDARDLEALLGVFRRTCFTGGSVIVRQGQPADSAFVLESGTVEVTTALPGGGQFVIAALGPGSVLGEMALLDAGVRTATALARQPTVAHVIEREDFRTLLAQRNPAVFQIQRRITLMLSQRLRDLNEKVTASRLPSENALPRIQPEPKPDARRTACAFDYRPFLPILPPLRHFRREDVDELLSLADVFDSPRGTVLFRENDGAAACFMVVRGAVEVFGSREGCNCRIGILGPGRLCGILALIEDKPHSMTAVLREDSTLLELAHASFERVYGAHTHLAARFHDLVNGEFLAALARTNNHLTRLISQAQILDRNAREAPKLDVDELQRALGEQDCRIAPR